MYLGAKMTSEEASSKDGSSKPCGRPEIDFGTIVIPLTATLGGLVLALAAALIYQLIRIKRLQCKLRSSQSDLSITYNSGRPILSSSELREPPREGIVNNFLDPHFPDGQMNIGDPSAACNAARNVNSIMLPPAYTMTSAATREILLRAASEFYPPPPYSECVTPSTTPVPPPTPSFASGRSAGVSSETSSGVFSIPSGATAVIGGASDASEEILFISRPTPVPAVSAIVSSSIAVSSSFSHTVSTTSTSVPTSLSTSPRHDIRSRSTSTTTTSALGSSVHSSSSSSSTSSSSGVSLTAADSWRYFVDGSPVPPVQLSRGRSDPDVVPRLQQQGEQQQQQQHRQHPQQHGQQQQQLGQHQQQQRSRHISGSSDDEVRQDMNQMTNLDESLTSDLDYDVRYEVVQSENQRRSQQNNNRTTTELQNNNRTATELQNNIRNDQHQQISAAQRTLVEQSRSSTINLFVTYV